MDSIDCRLSHELRNAHEMPTVSFCIKKTHNALTRASSFWAYCSVLNANNAFSNKNASGCTVGYHVPKIFFPSVAEAMIH